MVQIFANHLFKYVLNKLFTKVCLCILITPESAKNTAPPPRSPISLPQGGPTAQSKPLGQVAPNLQPGNLAGAPLVAPYLPPSPQKPQQNIQAPARQPFMVHSPSKPQQAPSQVIPPGSMAPPVPPAPQRLQQSPQKPFMMGQGSPQMAPHMGQGAPGAYNQSPYGAPPFRMQPPPAPMHGGGPVPPMGPGHRYPPPGQQGFYPGAMPMGPPPMIPPGIPPAVETLKGWCISQKLPPPKFTFQQTPQVIHHSCSNFKGEETLWPEFTKVVYFKSVVIFSPWTKKTVK